MDLEGRRRSSKAKDEHSLEPALVVQRNTCCKGLSCIFADYSPAGAAEGQWRRRRRRA